STRGPFYPADFVIDSGLERHVLDEALDHLRLRGLIGLTDWVQGKGQGYALTSRGALVLRDPKLLRRAQEVAPERAPAEGPPSTWERGEAVRDSLLNPARPVVCVTLLALNVFMFVLGLFLAVRQGATAESYLGAAPSKEVNAVRNDLGT